MGRLHSIEQRNIDVHSEYNILLLRWVFLSAAGDDKAELSLKAAIEAADVLRLPCSEGAEGPKKLLRPKEAISPLQVGTVLHDARNACPKNWRRALQIVEVGRVGLMRLRVGPRLKNCLNGYAATIEANALRVQERLTEAEDYLERAGRLLEAGSGALDALGYFLSIQASTKKDAWKLEEATFSAQAAALCFLRLGDEVRAAFSLINLAESLRASGAWQQAINPLRRAESLLPPADPTRNLLHMHQALVLADLGRPEEASFTLSNCRYEDLSSPVWKAQFHWVAGVVAREKASYEEARKHLLHALKAFEEGLAWPTVAPVILDLALAEFACGRLGELETLMDHLATLAIREDFPQPLTAPIWALRQACFQQSVTAAALGALRRQLLTSPLQALRQQPS